MASTNVAVIDNVASTNKKASGNNLDIPRMLRLLIHELDTFNQAVVPLSSSQRVCIQRSSQILAKPPPKRNTNKKRAWDILKDLWTHIPEVFILCALAIPPSVLGSLKSTKYLESIVTWWDSVPVPDGLRTAVNRYVNILPNLARENHQSTITITSSDLLSFLHTQLGNDTTMTVSLPWRGDPGPYIRIGDKVKIEMSWNFSTPLLKQLTQQQP